MGNGTRTLLKIFRLYWLLAALPAGLVIALFYPHAWFWFILANLPPLWFVAGLSCDRCRTSVFYKHDRRSIFGHLDPLVRPSLTCEHCGFDRSSWHWNVIMESTWPWPGHNPPPARDHE